MLTRNVMSIGLVLVAFGTPLAGAEPVAAGGKTPAVAHFDQAVAPLLAVRCLSCHNATERKGKLDLSTRTAAFVGGESGEAIVAGKPDESLLWEKIDANAMPPKKPLTAKERSILKEWIAAGAVWGTERIDPFRFTTESRAGYDWWALQPVRRPAVPPWKLVLNEAAGKAPPAGTNEIDAFIRVKLADKGLTPAQPADRRTLIRRVTYDLLGLPPTPEEVTAFVNDPAPNAYTKLVARLLDSPHYGVRWARHWLDLARFGESNGFEYDMLRERAWPYRDWVVNSLNADLPYDEFVRRQLAGDVLYPRDPAAVAATGFLVAGAFDGLVPAGDIMKQIMRQDVLEDFVGTVSQTFLGLTTHCARCHDHKFDPITQRDYYSLAASMAGVTHGERTVPPDPHAVEVAVELASAKQKLEAFEKPVRERILANRKGNVSTKSAGPSPLARWEFDTDLRDGFGGLHGETKGNAKVEEGALVLDGQGAYVATAPLAKEITEKTLEAWVRLTDLNQRGGGVITIQTLDGVMFDSIVFGELEERRWMAGSNGFARTTSFHGAQEPEGQPVVVHFAIVYRADGTVTAYRNGQPYGTSYKSSGPVTYAAGKAHLVFGLRHGTGAGGNRMFKGAIERAQLYDRALTDDEIAASAGVPSNFVSPADLAARLTPAQAQEHDRLLARVKSLGDEHAHYVAQKVYAIVPRTPDATHVLARGNPLTKQDVVAPGGIASLTGASANFGLPPDAPEGERRRKLAAWITDRQNPLFSRVLVNRLWHYHFGAGLVNTPNDFGFSGGRPSHPELLDWLAGEFVRQNFSLKRMHELIVTSATYQQASRPEPATEKTAARSPLTIDAENRLLWRKSPMRLEAESVRDAVLLVSGELNPQLGGPSYQDFNTYVHRGTRFYDAIDPEGAAFQRRSLYRQWARGGRSPFLDVFDCPDPSANSPSRAVTTTPLQALSLMNNSFILRMSDRFAERLVRDAGDQTAPQVVRLYQLAYQRPPRVDEQARLETFVQKHGLPALCRVILNSNEFLYVE